MHRTEGLGTLLTLAVTALKALDSTTGVNELLLTGKERVALIAQLHTKFAHRRASIELVAARASNPGELICGVNFGLHGAS